MRNPIKLRGDVDKKEEQKHGGSVLQTSKFEVVHTLHFISNNVSFIRLGSLLLKNSRAYWNYGIEFPITAPSLQSG